MLNPFFLSLLLAGLADKATPSWDFPRSSRARCLPSHQPELCWGSLPALKTPGKLSSVVEQGLTGSRLLLLKRWGWLWVNNHCLQWLLSVFEWKQCELHVPSSSDELTQMDGANHHGPTVYPFSICPTMEKMLLIKSESLREQNALCRGDVVSTVYIWILVLLSRGAPIWLHILSGDPARHCKPGPHSSTPPLQLVNSQPARCYSSSFLQPEPQTSSGIFGPLIRFPLPWIFGWLTEQCWLIFYNLPNPHLFFHVTKGTWRSMTK